MQGTGQQSYEQGLRREQRCRQGSFVPKILGRELGAANWAELGLYWGSPGGSDSKESASNARDLDSIQGQEDPLENGMATHSGIFA